MKGILTKDKPKEYYLDHAEFDKYFSSYMLARYLSMRQDLIIYARLLNHLNTAKLSGRNLFDWAWETIPKQRNGYIAYIKKEKKAKDAK